MKLHHVSTNIRETHILGGKTYYICKLKKRRETNDDSIEVRDQFNRIKELLLPQREDVRLYLGLLYLDPAYRHDNPLYL